jgi:hypothetical protein
MPMVKRPITTTTITIIRKGLIKNVFYDEQIKKVPKITIIIPKSNHLFINGPFLPKANYL